MTTLPETLRGYTDDAALGLDGYGAIVDYLLEHTPELLWPYSIRTYARMRHEPQLAAILKAYTLGIRRARWYVDGAGCRDEVTQLVADDLGLPINDADEAQEGARRRRFVFGEHLRLSLLDLTFGHMFFEQEWAQRDGRWHLEQVQERMPQTVAELKLNPDGTLAAMVQEPRSTGGQGPVLTAADHRLVYYVNDREGSNYFGQSLLRPAYGMWLIKDQMLRVHATSIRRFGMGVPEVQAPQGATPQQIAEAERTARTIKAGQDSGVGLPYGFTLALRGITGSTPDALGFINYLDRQMTRATLTSILDMATSENGARALGETVMDLLVYAQQAIADQHAEVATQQLVVPLVDANWGEDEPAPRVAVGDVGADLELTAEDIRDLAQFGMLIHDEELEGWIRARYGLPPIDQATRAPGPLTVTREPTTDA